MKIENIGGAAFAALNVFLTGTLALFQTDGVSTIGDIPQLAWIILTVGTALGFVKDAQALWTRRQLSRLTPGPMIQSPWLTGILAGLLALSMLSGCVTPRPKIDSIADGIAVTAADIETAAQTVKSLCRNTEPGGPCAADALISTDTKERLKNQLQEMLNALTVANLALSAADTSQAQTKLQQTTALLLILQAELARMGE